MINFRVCLFLFSRVNNCLKVLNLAPPITKKQIKMKYFELAKQLHPDVTDQENKDKSKKK